MFILSMTKGDVFIAICPMIGDETHESAEAPVDNDNPVAAVNQRKDNDHGKQCT